MGFGKFRLTRLPDRLVQIRLHHAGRERVHADTVRREILGRALHEVDQARLRRAVGRIGLRTHLAGDGYEKEQRRLGASDQLRRKDVGHGDRADQIDLQHARPVAGLKFPKGKSEFARADADREHDVVHRGQRGGGGLHLSERRHIAGSQRATTGKRWHIDVAIKPVDRAALGRKRLRAGPADPARGAEDCDVPTG